MKAADFELFVVQPADGAHAGLARAAVQAGATAFLDLEWVDDAERARANARSLGHLAAARVGLRTDLAHLDLALELLALLPAETPVILCGAVQDCARVCAALPAGGRRLLEVLRAEDVDAGALEQAGLAVDGFVARGFEAGGWVGADSSYILLQKAAARSRLPIHVAGGIGVHSAAACRAGGAAGVVLDDALLLLDESFLSPQQQEELSRLNGSETRLPGEILGRPCRLHARAGDPRLKTLESAAQAADVAEHRDAAIEQWCREAAAQVGWTEGRLLPLGQAVGLAAGFRERHGDVGSALRAVRRAAQGHLQQAASLAFLQSGGALAASHGTRYPLAQGPMTRVSDSPGFAAAVAAGGALPFLALALMRGEAVERMLQETRAACAGQPWGVGMLGFVPHELRQEQCQAIWRCKPDYALIAGGRPDQAAEFEAQGIPTYIHAPAPALLHLYLEQGARRFVFEGRECGGHIGPLSSFPLWEQMVEVLLREVSAAEAPKVHLLFAGGVHDARSAAMVGALTAPLAARGMKVGLLMGTAYLFTREIVETGAIVPGFQAQALACTGTASLETGPGHVTRCADTAFARDFHDERRRLLREGHSAEEIRDALEALNLGRLRVASKGQDRDGGGRLVSVPDAEQLARGMYMIGQVATLREAVTDVAGLHQSVADGAQALLRERAGLDDDAGAAEERPADIAVVGIGTLLPQSDGAEGYWDTILRKQCRLREVPDGRWDWKLYFDPDRQAKDKVYSRWGGFLDEIPVDPMAWGIPPKSMKRIDPIQLLTLEVVRRALDDAGWQGGAALDAATRERTSVILGTSGGLGDLGTQYAVRSELPRFVANPEPETWERLPEWGEESFAGSLLNVAAGRVANRLDFGGVNFTVDAACASSLAAVAMACNELESGRSRVVIAGGVDTVQSPFGFLCFSKTQALSPQGHPRTFDRAADGIAISEGLAVVALKRLADAEADGDRIYAVIKGCTGSSDGKALGLTAPRPEGQIRALDRVYRKAGFSPATLGLVEAHGTGTPVGDRAEAQTITSALRSAGAAPRSCALGSVKTLIGHTKAAAGIAGLIKVSLALAHRTLPAHYGVEQPIDALADPAAAVYLLREPRPWLAHPDHPRRGGASAFGFGGTNFHAALEEYPSAVLGCGADAWPQELFLFAAADRERLVERIERVQEALARGSTPRLRDLAVALAREAESAAQAPARLAVVAGDLAALRQSLEQALARLRRGDEGIALPGQAFRLTTAAPAAPPTIAFLFPGQGSQYVDMSREVALFMPEMREALELADRELRDFFPELLSRHILPPAAFDAETEQAQARALTDTRIAQPALGATALGYLGVARRLGLDAAAAAGHSYGEYTALAAAGVFSASDFLHLSAVRGQSMASAGASGPAGGMAAVWAARERLQPLVDAEPGVCIANHNTPEQCVISGLVEGLERISKQLEGDGVRVVRLPVSGAFHTELVAAAQVPLSAAIGATTVGAPHFPVYANSNAAPYPDEPGAIRETLDRHLLSSVEFVASVEAMHAAGCRVFLELGAKSVCSNLARKTLAGRDAVCLSLDPAGDGSLRGLLTGLADLHVAGVPLQAHRLFEGRGTRVLGVERLLADSHPRALPAHVWMVSGGCARPQDDPVQRNGRLPALDAEAVQAARQARAESEQTRDAPPQEPAMPRADAPAQPQASGAGMSMPPAPSPATGLPDAAVGEVFASYQQTMRQFLQLQEQVMQQFLGGGSSPAAGAAPSMPSMPAAALRAPLPPASRMPEAPAAPPVAPAPAVTSPVAAAAPREAVLPQATRDSETLLLEIVAERTGYPVEMLGLDQDLEAELGIDSIKRVEILGALQKKLSADTAAAMQANMEAYSRARSLRAVLDLLPAAPAAAPPTSTGAASPAPAPASVSASAGAQDRSGLQSLLLEIVAERTGYPAEMLGLDQDLEAELGIDSIKRVEILGALQKKLPADIAAAMQSGMERFTRARSLGAIIEAAVALAPTAGQPQTSVGTEPTSNTDEAPTQASAALDRSGLQALLLEIVAERTGYPAEMLGLDQDLEAELGIDSIKRVEILGALQKKLPADTAAAMQTGMERFTRARSLGAIIEAAVSLAPTAAAPHPTPQPVPAAAAPAAAVDAPVARLPRLLPRVQPAPLPRETAGVQGLHLLLGDGEGVAAALEARLRAAGVAVARLDAKASDIPTTIDALRAQHGAVGGLVLLDGLESTDEDTGGDRCTAAFCALQACAADFSKQGGVALAALRLGGAFGRDGQGHGTATLGGLAGLLNCARAEWKHLTARAVDFSDDLDAATVAERLEAELGVRDERREVAWQGEERVGFVHVAAEIGEQPFAPHLEPQGDWVMLVTGGARGITAQIALRMVRPGMRLVLVGRSPLPEAENPATAALQDPAAIKRSLLELARAAGRQPTPRELEADFRRLMGAREIRDNLMRLQEAGATVDYRSCDVRDPAAFGELIDGLYRDHGRIDAVIHGAGVIEDRLIVDKQADSFRRVYDTKVASALTLARKLRPDGLKLLAFFTSVAGRFGNAGQSDYGTANEALNRLAWQLAWRWSRTRVLAINWGPWEAGMADPAIRAQFEAKGLRAIPVEAGCRYFLDELAFGPHHHVELVAGVGPWSQEATAWNYVEPPESPTSRSDAGRRPLLRGAPRLAPGGAVTLELGLDLASAPYLADHCIDGRAVLPVAMALEHFAQFAAAAWPERRVLEVRDLRLLSGVVLGRDEHRDLLLRARASSHSDAGTTQLVTVELADAQSRRVHYRASLILGDRFEPAPAAPANLRELRPLDVRHSYDEYLFHGARFQLLQRIDGIAAEGADAGLQASTPRGFLGAEAGDAAWLFDPGVIDCALQMALIWGRVQLDKAALPARIGRAVRFDDRPLAGPLRLLMRLRQAPHEQALAYDAWFVDEQERPRLLLEGAESIVSSALNRLGGQA